MLRQHECPVARPSWTLRSPAHGEALINISQISEAWGFVTY